MGKRKRKSKDPDKIRKKIRRLERRLLQNDSSFDDYESDNSHYSGPSSKSIISIPQEIDDNAPIEPIEGITSSIEADNVNTGFDIQTSKEGELPPEVPALSADILEALGEPKDKIEIYAPKIRNEISERWGRIVVEGLSKESVQKFMENICFPENLKLLKAPELNPEISAVVTESTKNRDKRLEKAQNHLGKGIAAVTNLMSTLIDGELDKTEIIKKLSEIGQLLLDLHCQNTLSRRKLIMYSLDKKFSNIVQGVKRDRSLFGENLGERIKANKTAETSGFQIKRMFEPQASTSYRATPPTMRQGNTRAPSKVHYRDTSYQRGKRGGARNQASSQTTRHAPARSDRPKSNNNNKPPFKR